MSGLAALTTKHDKAPLIAPAVLSAVGQSCVLAEVDTDALGTFSGSVPRRSTPVETAICKARLGMHELGLPLGLASEGSIGPHPAVPMLPLDTELVVLVDDERGIVVTGSARDTGIRAASGALRPGEDPGRLLARADFPRHRLLVRPEGVPPTSETVHLGIADSDALAGAIATASGHSPLGLARVENDHRAHCSPSRRLVITSAAVDLASRLATRCPACESPGFGRNGYLFGLPCAWCRRTVPDAVRAEVFACPSCDHRQQRPGQQTEVDPGRCPACNP